MIKFKLITAFLTILMSILIGYFYTDYVVIEYDYWFYANSPIIELYVFYIVCAFISSAANQNLKKPSDLFAWIFYLLITIPTISLTPYLAENFLEGFMLNFMMLAGNLVLFLISRIDEKKIIPKFKGFSIIQLKFFIVFITIILIGVVSRSYNFNIGKILDLSIFIDTYDIRADFREVKSGVSLIASYSIYWLAKFFLPFFICYGLAFKKKNYIIIGFLLQILIFSISAHKSFVFSAVLICAVYFLLIKNYKLYQWMSFLNLFLISSFIFYKFLNLDFFINVIIRRAFIIPGVLSNWWYSYFSNNGFVYFKDTFLGGFFHSSYSMRAPFVIGLQYFGNDWTSANANFMIDAFANGGWICVLILMLILIFILLIINRYASYCRSYMIFISLLSIPIFWSFMETSFFIILITHGLFILTLFTLFLRPDTDKVK